MAPIAPGDMAPFVHLNAGNLTREKCRVPRLTPVNRGFVGLPAGDDLNLSTGLSEGEAIFGENPPDFLGRGVGRYRHKKTFSQCVE